MERRPRHLSASLKGPVPDDDPRRPVHEFHILSDCRAARIYDGFDIVSLRVQAVHDLVGESPSLQIARDGDDLHSIKDQSLQWHEQGAGILLYGSALFMDCHLKNNDGLSHIEVLWTGREVPRTIEVGLSNASAGSIS